MFATILKNVRTGAFFAVLAVSLAFLAATLPPVSADEPDQPKKLLGVYLESKPVVLKTPCFTFAAFRDGSKVVCADRKYAQIYDMTTGERWKGLLHSEVVIAVALSPDEKSLLTVTAGRESPVRLWSLERGEMLREYPSPFAKSPIDGEPAEEPESGWNRWQHPRIWRFPSTGYVPKTGFGFTSVAFSPSGREFATGCENGSVIVWNTETGKEIARIRSDARRLWSVVFSQDGKRLLTSSMGERVQLWDIPARTLVKQYHEDNARRWVSGYRIPLAFSSDGERFAFLSPKSLAIRICDAKSGEEVCRLPENCVAKNHHAVGLDGIIAFLPGDKKLLTNTMWVLKVWDIDAKKVESRHVAIVGSGWDSYPNVEYVRYLPAISAAIAVEVENDESTQHEDWTTIAIVPLSKFEAVSEGASAGK